MSKEISGSQLTYHFELTNAKIDGLSKDVEKIHVDIDRFANVLEAMQKSLERIEKKVNHIDSVNERVKRAYTG